jgi:hypothetical protein
MKKIGHGQILFELKVRGLQKYRRNHKVPHYPLQHYYIQGINSLFSMHQFHTMVY